MSATDFVDDGRAHRDVVLVKMWSRILDPGMTVFKAPVSFLVLIDMCL